MKLHSLGKAHPEFWIIVLAAKWPARTDSDTGLPRTICARKPPQKASPAPLVSTSISLGRGSTS